MVLISFFCREGLQSTLQTCGNFANKIVRSSTREEQNVLSLRKCLYFCEMTEVQYTAHLQLGHKVSSMTIHDTASVEQHCKFMGLHITLYELSSWCDFNPCHMYKALIMHSISLLMLEYGFELELKDLSAENF